MGPAGVRMIVDLAGEASRDKLVCIIKCVLLTQGAGVVHPVNSIHTSDLPVGGSER